MPDLLGTNLALPNDDPLERISILDAYQYSHGLSATTHMHAGRYMVRCPAADHDDNHPSCSLNPANDTWYCFGCGKKGGKLSLIIAAGNAKTNAEAMDWLKRFSGRAMGRILSFPDQPAMKVAQVRGPLEELTNERLVGEYSYNDEAGQLVRQVLRYEGTPAAVGGRDKRFEMRAPDKNGRWKHQLSGVRRVPYRLPEIIAAAQAKRSIILVEGEKHADALAHIGLHTTTVAGGTAQEWDFAWNRFIEDSPIIFVLGDADKTGRKAMDVRAKALSRPGRDVILVDLFPDRSSGDDILDWMVEEAIVADPRTLKGVPYPIGQATWAKLLRVPVAEARRRVIAKLTGFYLAQKKAP